MLAICTTLLPLTSISLVSLPMQAADSPSPRLVLPADSGWKFTLGDPSGADAPSFADTAWRTVDLPHDWSIESPPDKDNPSGAGGGFFPNGIGWYRKTFTAPADWRTKRVSVEFDGVYRDATVYLNGHKLGTHPYGYTSFTFDLTPDLNFTGPNVLAVRVDNSAQPNSRWYSGSGIYRHVRVVVTDPTHVAHWGVFVTTPKVSDDSATVSIQTKVANDSANPANITVETTLYDHAGNAAGTTKSPLTIAPGMETEAAQTITVANPLSGRLLRQPCTARSPKFARVANSSIKSRRPSASAHSPGPRTRGFFSMAKASSSPEAASITTTARSVPQPSTAPRSAELSYSKPPA